MVTRALTRAFFRLRGRTSEAAPVAGGSRFVAWQLYRCGAMFRQRATLYPSKFDPVEPREQCHAGCLLCLTQDFMRDAGVSKGSLFSGRKV